MTCNSLNFLAILLRETLFYCKRLIKHLEHCIIIFPYCWTSESSPDRMCGFFSFISLLRIINKINKVVNKKESRSFKVSCLHLSFTFTLRCKSFSHLKFHSVFCWDICDVYQIKYLVIMKVDHIKTITGRTKNTFNFIKSVTKIIVTDFFFP